ncbi:GPI ethanolamine phosphate transferase 2 [Gryllus bimaculatus]|nr:GPI ethanolamine phosphate transferase 2 [Gryllus bimaculatus]
MRIVSSTAFSQKCAQRIMNYFSLWRNLYCMISGAYVLFVFIRAFLPMTNNIETSSTYKDIPSHIGSAKINVSDVYQNHIDRVIIMVIDALRVDFVDHLHSKINMPYVHSMLERKEAFIVVGNVQTPTVTMPRLKVDNNVTQHLENELAANDWEIMILHYLGLDHIGHLEGPKSAHINPKLLEMDLIVKKIHYAMIEWAETLSLRSILIICGDHGMKDSGGHGGATTAETTVPIITLGVRQHSPAHSGVSSVSQIDLVPTLSVLLGLPIPKCNIGKLIPQFFQKFSMKKKLFAYYYNAKQVTDHFKEINSYHTTEAYLKYEEATRLHELWIKSNYQIVHDAKKSEELYQSSLEDMSEILGNIRVTQDVFCLLIAICINLQICGILLFQNTNIINTSSGIFHIFIFIFTLSFFNILYCLSSESESAVCKFNMGNALGVTLPNIVLISINISIITNSCTISWFSQSSRNQALKWFLVGSGLHLISFLSSSFIEEEHQVWYFGWLTFLMFVLSKQCQISYLSGSFKNIIIFWSLILIICHRILRKLNQTGDKWASVPDISDWLHEPHNIGAISLVFILGLLGNGLYVGYCQWILSDQSIILRGLYVVLCSLSLFMVYLYRAATGAVLTLFDSSVDLKGITEARLFWCFLLLMTVQEFTLTVSRQEKLKIHFIGSLMKWSLSSWILLVSLLHRPHNVLLPGVQAFASIFLNTLYKQTFKTKFDTCWLSIAHCWLGMVFYFYQGNSNSVATVDVASGYVGLQDYNPFVVGYYLVVNTFAAPVLSLLLLVSQLVWEAKSRGIHWWVNVTGSYGNSFPYRDML